ncbi:hypothetical protein [Virgibacillus sp. YIM 98842]|uniref:magnesium transporter MgtE N-terminal domain-containing protein n=1 Tax=Virgibacillus sp. YIM 98842 TaxID=2663533 RepID=UPI0013DC4C2A|nr:hypothetical protein [Virgibacillus sp. YIM 98842]
MRQILEKGEKLAFQKVIKEMHPYDFADLYKHLSTQHKNKILTFLTDDKLAELIEALVHQEQIEVLEKLELKNPQNLYFPKLS